MNEKSQETQLQNRPNKEKSLSAQLSDEEINSIIQEDHTFPRITDTKEKIQYLVDVLDTFSNKYSKTNPPEVREIYNGKNERQYDGYQTIAKGNGKYSYEPLYQSKISKHSHTLSQKNEKIITPEKEQRKEQIKKNVSNLEYLLELLNTSENIKQIENNYTQDTLVEYNGKKHVIKDIVNTADGRTVYHLEDEYGNPIQEGGVKKYVGKDNLTPWTEKEKVVPKTTANVKEQLEKIQNDGITLVVLDSETS